MSVNPEAPIGVIAGNGRLPAEVLHALQRRGRSCFVLALKGEADQESLKAYTPHWYSWGQIGGMLDALKAAGCRELALVGGVANRPDFLSIVGDIGTIRRIPKIVKAMTGGDDSLLRRVIGLIEEEGFLVRGLGHLAPELLAVEGNLSALSVDEASQQDIDVGLSAIQQMGSLDIGQALVVINRRIVAVEAAEGTDAMLQRVADLRQSKRIGIKGQRGVLVKAAKPGQELRVDLPTIGPKTLAVAKAAQLSGIAVEAGRVLIVDRDSAIEKADQSGLFLSGCLLKRGGSRNHE